MYNSKTIRLTFSKLCGIYWGSLCIKTFENYFTKINSAALENKSHFWKLLFKTSNSVFSKVGFFNSETQMFIISQSIFNLLRRYFLQNIHKTFLYQKQLSAGKWNFRLRYRFVDYITNKIVVVIQMAIHLPR